MNTWQTYERTYELPSTCLHCGDPIEQPRHGGRPRQYCDKPACRKAGSRTKQRLAAEREAIERKTRLRQTWQRYYDETTRATLEEILHYHGIEAAERATEALRREMVALRNLAEARRIVAEDESKRGDTPLPETLAAELEQRLTAIREIEVRFRLDTEARHFKAWLRKQRVYPPDSFPHRFLEDRRLPLYASRSLYEAKLRACSYSEEDIQQFYELWKALLIAQG